MASRPPIAFFAFNRPAHAAAALEALSRCKGAADSALHVFVDGPRSAEEAGLCTQVAEVAAAASGFASVSVARSPRNKGLYRSITEGVSAVLETADSLVVVEDDILVTEDFLDYAAFYLDAYASSPEVGCVHGYALPVEGLPEFYFLRGGDCWGWATWKDRWQLFRPDAGSLLGELRERGLLDDYMGTHGAPSLEMLCDRAQGRNQSWAILWHASLFLSGRLTLHPGRSFVQNIGNDGSGTHTSATQRFQSVTRDARHHGFEKLPVREDPAAAALTSAFMDGHPRRRLLDRWMIALRRQRAKLRAARLPKSGGPVL